MAYKQELWDEAKRKFPNKKEMWKAPVKDWIHDMYERRQRKTEQKAKRKRENKQ